MINIQEKAYLCGWGVLLGAHSQCWLTVYPVCVVFLPSISEGVGGLRSECC